MHKVAADMYSIIVMIPMQVPHLFLDVLLQSLSAIAFLALRSGKQWNLSLLYKYTARDG